MDSTWYAPKPYDKIVTLLKTAAEVKKGVRIVVRIMPGDEAPRLGRMRWHSKSRKWQGKRRAIEVGRNFLAHYGVIHHFVSWNQ